MPLRLCSSRRRKAPLSSFTAPKAITDDLPVAAEEEDTVAERFGGSRRVVDRESDYSKRRFNRTLSPTRDEGTTTYAERVREAQLDRERDNTTRQIVSRSLAIRSTTRSFSVDTDESGPSLHPPSAFKPA